MLGLYGLWEAVPELGWAETCQDVKMRQYEMSRSATIFSELQNKHQCGYLCKDIKQKNIFRYYFAKRLI